MNIKIKKTTLLILTASLLAGCYQPTSNPQTTTFSSRQPISYNLIPAAQQKNAVVHHKAYTLEYNESYEQARWVAYMLTADHSQGDVPRTNFFDRDPLVSTISAHYEDYRGSGYTRGHLCPAGDMRWDTTAMRETFYMSNISPQLADFNDGIWNKVEMQARQWARDYDSIYIVTGPVIEEDCRTIGRNKVAVPSHFFKVIYAPSRQEGIAFLVPHQKTSKTPRHFIVSIDQVEEVTGIDFFPELPDDIEQTVESSSDVNRWKW